MEGWWWRTVTGSGLVVPDGAIDVMWTPDRPAWVAGPDTRPYPIELRVGTIVVGLRLRPGAAPAVLGQGADAAVDTSVPVSAVWSAALVRRLDDGLGAAISPAEMAEALALAVETRVEPHWQPDPLVASAVGRLRRSEPLDDLGLSPRQLRRRFTTAMGYGPAFYRRIVRLDRFSALADRWPDRSTAELAAEAGYFDEAHLGRDARALTGAPPARLRAGGG